MVSSTILEGAAVVITFFSGSERGCGLSQVTPRVQERAGIQTQLLQSQGGTRANCGQVPSAENRMPASQPQYWGKLGPEPSLQGSRPRPAGCPAGSLASTPPGRDTPAGTSQAFPEGGSLQLRPAQLTSAGWGGHQPATPCPGEPTETCPSGGQNRFRSPTRLRPPPRSCLHSGCYSSKPPFASLT